MAVVFGIFGGRLGLHRLYCGKIGTGLLYLLVEFLTGCKFIDILGCIMAGYFKIYRLGGGFSLKCFFKDFFDVLMASKILGLCLFLIVIRLILRIFVIVDLVLIVRKKFKDKSGFLVCSNERLVEKKKKVLSKEISEKNWAVLLVLTFFGGFLGLHRFYCGKIVTAIFYFLTCGFLGIGILVDLILIFKEQFEDFECRVIIKNKNIKKSKNSINYF